MKITLKSFRVACYIFDREISFTKLSQKFMAYTRYPLHGWINDYDMSSAGQRLINTDRNVINNTATYEAETLRT